MLSIRLFAPCPEPLKPSLNLSYLRLRAQARMDLSVLTGAILFADLNPDGSFIILCRFGVANTVGLCESHDKGYRHNIQ